MSSEPTEIGATSESRTAIALLGCGHWFREHRPAKLRSPRQGELRACGHPEHYPNQYPATYVVEVKGS